MRQQLISSDRSKKLIKKCVCNGTSLKAELVRERVDSNIGLGLDTEMILDCVDLIVLQYWQCRVDGDAKLTS
jgi:hypothetical protein